jgi:mono/diheme cytochrome c family protein
LSKYASQKEETRMLTRYFRAWVKPKWIGVVVMLGVLWSGTVIAAGNGDIEKGKDLFRESCRHCHGFAGKGDGEMADYLEPRPSNLASQTTQAKSDKDLKDVILKGRAGTAMVGFEGAIEESQITDLLAYLRSLKP